MGTPLAMGRDDALMRRMYGEPPPPPEPPPPRVTAGVLPAFWLVGLLSLAAIAAFVAVGSLVLAAAFRAPDLEGWGVIGPADVVVAYHDHSVAADGSSGCVVTADRVARWDDGRPTGSVVLAGAEVIDGPEGLTVRGEGEVSCPFEPGEDRSWFSGALTRARSTTPGGAR